MQIVSEMPEYINNDGYYNENHRRLFVIIHYILQER